MTTTSSLKELLSDQTMASAPELVVDEGEGAVRCLACGHRCLIRPGKAGVCRVRMNRDGELRVPGGYVAGLQVDPIEKKPFYHAFPGREALSFGMLGCDLHCSYCQNWVTSQALRDDAAVSLPRFCSAEELVALAVSNHAPVVVSTYNEPLITADWAMQVFEKAAEQGLACGFVSNGNATPEVLDYLKPVVSLYKVDLKSFDDRQYRKLGAVLSSVLRTIEGLKERGFWIEIVTLVIPGFNDSDAELSQMAKFIAGVSEDIPWHVTAFHPDYKMNDIGRTPTKTLVRAYEIGKEAGLRFVYPGNIAGAFEGLENTYCPSCDALAIQRHGFYVQKNTMKGGRCSACDSAIPGVWEDRAPTESNGPGIPRPLAI